MKKVKTFSVIFALLFNLSSFGQILTETAPATWFIFPAASGAPLVGWQNNPTISQGWIPAGIDPCTWAPSVSPNAQRLLGSTFTSATIGTAYFYTTFNVTKISDIQSLLLRYNVDDNAEFWLNGTSIAITGNVAGGSINTRPVFIGNLLCGTNTLAVRVTNTIAGCFFVQANLEAIRASSASPYSMTTHQVLLDCTQPCTTINMNEYTYLNNLASTTVVWSDGITDTARVICNTDTYIATSTVNNCIDIDTFIVSSQNCCPYKIDSVLSSSCETQPSTICVPLKAKQPVPNGMIGMDFCMKYDPAFMTPTGDITLGGVVLNSGMAQPSDADVFVYVDAPNSRVCVSIYYTSTAPLGTQFMGMGDVACVEFTIIPGGTNGPLPIFLEDVDINNDGIIDGSVIESYDIDVQAKCADNGGVNVVNEYEGLILYWNDLSRPLPGNSGLPNQINITQTDAACLPSPIGNNTVPDQNGQFSLSPITGTTIQISRDISNSVPGGLSVMNGQDCYLTSLVTTNNATTIPPPFPSSYQILAMNVNRNNSVTAGDITLIQQRITGAIGQFPQSSSPSKDWLFVDKNTVDNNLGFIMSSAYPNSDPTGYYRFRLPSIPLCLPLPADTCSGEYHGILLGDVDGSWTSADAPQYRRSTPLPTVVFDLENAIVNQCEFRIPVYYDGTDNLTALDFSMDYDNNNISFLEAGYEPTGLNNMSKMDNIYNGDLLFTSYSKIAGGFNATQPLYFLHFSSNHGSLTAQDLGDIKTYINGEEANSRITASSVACSIGTGTENISNTNDIALSPNPTDGVIHITHGIKVTQLDLFDMQGKFIMEIPVHVNGITTLDINSLAAGVYAIRINGLSTKRIIKK